MNILIVNKFLYPKGGAETYVQKLGALLQSHGHRVQYFGLANGKNTLGNDLGALVSDIDFSTGILPNLHAPLRILYSREARRKIRRILDHFQPDIVHLNNIQFHLTPSVILEIHKYRTDTRRNVRIIYSAHDYQLVCPSHGLLDASGQICEKCLDGHYFHCILGRCIKHSRAKSLLAALDACVWKHSRAYSHIDTILCCSQFLKSKLDTQPRFREKTVVLRNFSDPVKDISSEKEGYVLEFGHLSQDKGTPTLLEAARNMPDVRFVFAGFGSAVEEIRTVPNAEYVGFLTGEALEKLVRTAAVTVCPSLWYENCPFSVIESQAWGTPVVASRIGGIPELIAEGCSGELFTPGDPRDLEAKLRSVLAQPERYRAGCRQAPLVTPETYYRELMKIYGASHEDL